MADSVHTRVALRYSALFTLLAVAIGIGIYVNLQHDAYQRLDVATRSLLAITVSELRHEWDEHGSQRPAEASLRDVVNTVYQTSFPQEQLAVWEGSRLVVYKANTGRTQADLRLAPVASAHPVLNWRDLRIVVTEYTQPRSRVCYRIAVSTWRGDTQNDLATLSSTLAIVIPLAILFAIAAGYIIARRTLAPLSRITERIDGITPESLSVAIPVPAAPDEVRRLAARFNSLLERLQFAFAQRQRFMADASHELRTPVSAALTAAQVTLRDPNRGAANYREALSIVEEQLLRLRRIVEDMFLLARADSASLPVRVEELYFDELVAEAARAMRLLAERSAVTLSLAQPLPEAPLHGDPGLLRQAIIILLDNACKYNRPGGQVFVCLEIVDGQCILRVKDDGPGIPEHAHQLIFERFYRVDSARGFGHTNGSGLGLSIARWIATQHKGELSLESSGESGSTFKLTLPLQ